MQTQLGYYGKIPCKGDFISRQLPRLFIEPWDQWLQECIISSREQLSEDWLQNYLVSPIWRFALSAGIVGEHAWIGILIPSVDQVGRYFPLTLAVPVHATQPLLEISTNEEAWFTDVEEIALSALEQENNFNDFNRKVDNLGTPKSLHRKEGATQHTQCNSKHVLAEQWRITTLENVSLNSRFNILLQQLMLDRFRSFSLWWTQGSEHVQPTLFVSPDLPPAHKYQTFLTDA
ncbi:MAG: type VI secretion system-associated protein TagF [Thiohalomonadales bacterium]